MNNVHKCVMWIVSAIVAITGIVITKDLESAIWIMMIPLAASIFIQWKIYFNLERRIVNKFMGNKNSLENIYYKVRCYYNVKAEQYIKTSLLEDDKPKKSKFSESVQFEEVSEAELEKDDKEGDNGAIVLGVKKQNVHILDDLDTQENHENSTSILQDMDSDSNQWVISEKYTNVMSVEDLDDNNDDVKQEFNSLSKRMKVLMVTNAFGKKQDK